MNNDSAEKLLIGWGHADITPDRPVLLAGQFYTRISQGVRDPLTVTVLALEKGDQRILMASCDLVQIKDETLAAIRERLAEDIPELDPRYFFAHATHTHTGPVQGGEWYSGADDVPDLMTGNEYRVFLADKVAAAAVQAWANRSPGGISRGYARAVVGHNRRGIFLDGSAKMYPDATAPDFSAMEGAEDSSLNLLFTWNESSKLTGVMVNVACPSQVSEHEERVSADFWHEARQQIRSVLGDDIHVMAQCAPAGDQSPRPVIDRRLEEEQQELRKINLRQQIGDRIAQGVRDAWPYAQNIDFDPVFYCVAETVDLSKRKMTDEEYAHCKQVLEQLKDPEFAEKLGDYAGRVEKQNLYLMERYAAQGVHPVYPVELYALRLGDAAIATNPFELFLDFGLRMKTRSPAAQTFLIQLAGSGSYLPTQRAVMAKMHYSDERLALGLVHNYGASIGSTQVGPEGGQELVEWTLAKFQEMFG